MVFFVFALSFADSDSLQDVPAVQTQDEEEKNMKRKSLTLNTIRTNLILRMLHLIS